MIRKWRELLEERIDTAVGSYYESSEKSRLGII
jgi:hypothetical protein